MYITAQGSDLEVKSLSIKLEADIRISILETGIWVLGMNAMVSATKWERMHKLTAATLLTTFWNAIVSMKKLEFWSKCYWSLYKLHSHIQSGCGVGTSEFWIPAPLPRVCSNIRGWLVGRSVLPLRAEVGLGRVRFQSRHGKLGGGQIACRVDLAPAPSLFHDSHVWMQVL